MRVFTRLENEAYGSLLKPVMHRVKDNEGRRSENEAYRMPDRGGLKLLLKLFFLFLKVKCLWKFIFCWRSLLNRCHAGVTAVLLGADPPA